MTDVAMLAYLFLPVLLSPFIYVYNEIGHQHSLRTRGYWTRR